MSSPNLIQTLLSEKGIVALPPPIPQEVLKGWNLKLDPLFQSTNTDLTYVGITKLIETGIFEELFNPEIRKIIRSIMPDAVVRTITCFENVGNQKESTLIKQSLYHGWHGDVSPNLDLTTHAPHYVGLFIYLSDVGRIDGGTEVCPARVTKKTFRPSSEFGKKTFLMTGEMGTAFAFNKAFLHRPSPNQGSKPRRVMRIEFQNNYLQNRGLASESNINALEHFKNQSPPDPFLKFFLGGSHTQAEKGAQLPKLPEYDLPLIDITETDKVRVSPRQVWTRIAKDLIRHKLKLKKTNTYSRHNNRSVI